MEMRIEIVLGNEACALSKNRPERAFGNFAVEGDDDRLRTANREATHFNMRAILADGGKAEPLENRNQLAPGKGLIPSYSPPPDFTREFGRLD